MGIINSNFSVNLGRPIDDKYMNGSTPWTSTGAVDAAIPTTYRYCGLTVNILGEEWWYKDGVNLILKSTGGIVTGADNGLTLAGTTIKLGGTLTGVTTITRGAGNIAGIEYGGDYSVDFSPESLVTKRYVDTLAAGLHTILAAKVATTTPINLTTIGLGSIDGLTVITGDRVLVKDQSTSNENGIYSASTGTWGRTSDFYLSGQTLQGSLIPVISGSTNKNTLWVLISPNPILSSDPKIFTLFSSSAYIAGTGIDIAGSTISLDANSIAVINGALTGATNGLSLLGRDVCLGGTLGSALLTASGAGNGLAVCSTNGSNCNLTSICDGTFTSTGYNVGASSWCSAILNNGYLTIVSKDGLCCNQICFRPDGTFLTIDGYPSNTGFQYTADYCNLFNANIRAIPDVDWVKRYVSGSTISGTATHIPVFNALGSNIEDTTLTFASDTLTNSNSLSVIGTTGLNLCGGSGRIALCGLPVKTSETCAVYLDASGNLSYGLVSGGTGGGGGGAGMGVFTITGNAVLTGFTINHGFNQTYVDVAVIDGNAPFSTIYTGVFRPTVNDVCITFNTAPDLGHPYKVLIATSGATGSGGGVGTITGGTNGLGVIGRNICLGGTIASPTIITDVRGTPVGIEYAGDYSSTFTDRSLIDKGYSDIQNQSVIKKVNVAHTFVVGNVVGWSSAGAYDKPIANGAYNGEILGVVSKVVDSNNFEITLSGYIQGLTALSPNYTYFLSDVTAGLMTLTEPLIVGHVSKAVLIANSSTTGYVLPYAGYVVSTGGEGGGTNTKQITQTAHGFHAGDAIGWSGGTYNKAIANGEYNGEVIGLVSKRVSVDIFDLTQAGYVSGITGLTTSTTYFLSDSLAGKLTQTKPTVLGHVVRAMFITDTSASGWVLPYPGYLLTTGSTSSGTTVGAGIGLINNSSVFDVRVTDTTSLGGYVIPVKIDSLGTRNYLFIDSDDITGSTGGGTITGATNLGGGVGVYANSIVDKKLEFDSFVGSGGTTVQKVGNEIIVRSNTASGSQQYSGQTPSAVALCGIGIGYQLTGKTVSCILQDLLVPELFQTSVGTPTTTVGLTFSGLREVGYSGSQTITPSYTTGVVTPPYQSTAPYTRGGAANNWSYTGPSVSAGFNGSSSCNIPSYSVVLGAQTWSVCTRYDVGSCIKGSKGTVNPSYPTKCPQDSISNTGSASVTGIYPYYYGYCTTALRPTGATITSSFITGGTKVNTANVGTLTTVTIGSIGQWAWFAIPQTCNSMNYWCVDAFSRGSVNTSPSDTFPDEQIASISSGQGCWAGVNYKVYVSGTVVTIPTVAFSTYLLP